VAGHSRRSLAGGPGFTSQHHAPATCLGSRPPFGRPLPRQRRGARWRCRPAAHCDRRRPTRPRSACHMAS
jgi:hypothetical protein